jgi:chromosome segregation ATPase
MRSNVPVMGVAVAVVFAALAFSASLRGQEPLRQDVLGTLLLEVRALRGAIEQMVSAGARVQLATGRLQIQEQRVNTLSRQLFELRQSLAAVERQRIEREAELADLEGVLPGTSDPGERQAIAQRVGELKAILAAGTGGLQKLRSDETELAGVVAAEQSRWADLNQQLDALDRTLRQ